MVSYIVRLFIAVCVLLIITPVLSITTVSIDSLFPGNQHVCVTRCIYTNYYSDVGNVLSCGNPYANDCFCNTAPASASAATSWLEACGSSSCSAGDLSDDLNSMFSIYASYCVNAGFTQPGATEYYNPTTATARPGPTPTSGPAPTSGSTLTTTQVTLVTQTASSTGGSSATQSQVIVTVHTTSTLLVGSNSSPVPISSNSGPNKIALGVGLGVGITLALIVVGVGLWLCLRRRSPRTEEPQPPIEKPVVRDQVSTPVMGVSGASPILRKPVPSQSKSPASQTTELTGEGVRRELSGRDNHSFSQPVSPSSSAAVPGEHEMSGEGLSRELPGQSRSPPPDYSHEAASPPGLVGQGYGQGPRWELG